MIQAILVQHVQAYTLFHRWGKNPSFRQLTYLKKKISEDTAVDLIYLIIRCLPYSEAKRMLIEKFNSLQADLLAVLTALLQCQLDPSQPCTPQLSPSAVSAWLRLGVLGRTISQ